MVSLIIPMREERGYLKQCLESIEAQTYRDFEVIQVKNNASVAVNSNIGLAKAKGEYFKEVGDDDWLPPNSLQDLVDGMKGNDWIVANSINVYSDHQTEEIVPADKLNLKDMVFNNVIHNGGTMYRTEVLREIGGMDETLWTGEEYEMHLRLMAKGIMPAKIEKFVYYYRIHHYQKSRQLRIQNKQRRHDEIKRIQALYSDKV